MSWSSDVDELDVSSSPLRCPSLFASPSQRSSWFHLRIESPSGGISGLGVASAAQDECVFARGDGAVLFDVVLLRAGGALEAFIPDVLISGGSLAVATSAALDFSPRTLFSGDAARAVAARAFPDVLAAARAAGCADDVAVVAGDVSLRVPAGAWRGVVAGDAESASARLLRRQVELPSVHADDGGHDGGAVAARAKPGATSESNWTTARVGKPR
jgi:hypothetical protein